MDYHAAADFLSDLRRFALDPGTESIRELLAYLDDPHEDVAFVQVAGSNGKGSTARMTESILREAGYRTGLYTSPHFDDIRERVRVDGRKITESAVVEFVEEVRPFLVRRAVEGDPITSFEALTAMSLWYFGRSDVDVAVLEVGMGGRLDATSVVDPVAAAVGYLLRLLSKRDYTRHELATRLARRGVDEGSAGAALARLEELDLLDDARVGAAHVRGRAHRKGRLALARDLAKRGVDEATREALLGDLNDAHQREAAEGVLRKERWRFADRDPRKNRAKAASFLTRRGFPSDVVRDVVEDAFPFGDAAWDDGDVDDGDDPDARSGGAHGGGSGRRV